METELAPPQLSEREVSEIRLYCEIAEIHQVYLTLSELSSLVRGEITEEELERAWQLNPMLSDAYTLHSRMIIPRGKASAESAPSLEAQEAARRIAVQKGIRTAQNFARFAKTSDLRLFSVSGSISYRSASKDDDVDFFCITERGTMWIFLARMLILARISHLLHADLPNLCFSCTMDRDYALKQFAGEKSPLFARDALNAFVIEGSDYYHDLVSRGGWMSQYFPKIYKVKAANLKLLQHQTYAETTIVKKSVNLFLFLILNTYIQLKSYLLNRKLSRQGKVSALFTVKSGKNHLIYESSRYGVLRQLYSHLLEARD